jgi:hypothetical protein
MKFEQYKAIAKQIDEEINAVLAKHGLKIGRRNANVDELAGTIAYRVTLVDLNLTDDAGNKTTPERQRWLAFAPVFDLDLDWLDQKIKHNPAYTVVGLREGKSEKCVVVEKGGKRYVMRPDAVRLQMGAADARTVRQLARCVKAPAEERA